MNKTQRNENILRRQVFPIPVNVAPVGTRCVMVNIPDDDEHQAIFMGAIDLLCKWNSWQRDGTDNAVRASEAWKRAIYDNPVFERCEMQVQFRQLTSCVLEASFDGGDTWDQIYTAENCVKDGISEAIDDGVLSPAGQQEPGGTGVIGQCYSYHVRLDGNGRWKCPIPVNAGDRLTVTNAKGGWYDGNAITLGQWNCPDGSGYVLGECGVASVGPVGTDPAPTINHMRLIGNSAAESPAYFDMYNLEYEIVATGDNDFYLQANDSQLDDNQGSITLDIELCKGGWTHDLLCGHGNDVLKPHWVAVAWSSGFYPAGSYYAPSDQMRSADNSGGAWCGLRAVLDFTGITGFMVTKVHVSCHLIQNRADPASTDVDQLLTIDGTTVASHTISKTFVGTDDFDLDSGDISITDPGVIAVELQARETAAGQGLAYLTCLKIEGLQTNPFS